MNTFSTTLLPEIYKEYKNNIFFETGTFMGGGVELALHFNTNKIISVEIIKKLYDQCVLKFNKEILNKQVELFYGNSPDVIKNILPNLTDKITFWLDGHKDGSNPHENKNTHSPLMQELEAIKNYSTRNDNVILIDDIRMFHSFDDWAGNNNYHVKDVENFIKNINNNYKIDYKKNGDILIAYV
jgi:hypothetical protein